MANTTSISCAPSLNVLDLSKEHTFIKPVKKIHEGHDVTNFLTCKAYSDILIFLLQLNRAMFPSYVQKSESDQKKEVHMWDLGSTEVVFSETVLRLRSLLEALNRIIDEVPPDTGPRRFGNASFRKWYQIVEEQSANLLSQYLPNSIMEYASQRSSEASPLDEISSYFLGSFGSAQRLDYGSGHELSFLASLGCIWKLGGFNISDSGNEERGIVLGIIDPYLNLIRRLIKTYTLEPAGSHGVWGLDDHSFIPYILGSAQYGPPISPEDQTPTEGSREGAPKTADVTKKMAVDRERNTNLYFGAIGFIYDVKKGPFWEHSPMLYDISGVQAGWGKINKVSPRPTRPDKRSLIYISQGMLKMYNAEVLSKFPVVQHFPFGSLFSWEQDPNSTPPPTSIHASSQPIRDGPALSLENSSARAQPQEGTKAPWANKSTAVPKPGAGIAAPWANQAPSATGNRVGTTAPWASRPTGIASSGTGTAAPWANNRPTPPPQATATDPSARTALPLRSTDSSGSDAGAMPPPTKAPWAK